MSFRTRLFVATLATVLIPLGALAIGVRREMERRLTKEYEGRVGTVAEIIEDEIRKDGAAVAARLDELASSLAADNRFRLAVIQRAASARRHLLDYAGEAMRLSGLSMLQVQDSSGRILSSGHFRNEFDRLQPELLRLLASGGEKASLVRTRTPEGPLLALARLDSFTVSGQRFMLVGGLPAEGRLLASLARDRGLSVTLVHPGSEAPVPSGGRVLREVAVSYVDLLAESVGSADTARYVIAQTLGTLEALKQSVDRWFLAAVALTIALALALAAWLSARISQPLRELARKTADLDLDRLDQSFDSERHDEVGALSRLLGGMTERLRTSTAKLRDAERRAAVGDVARQVNHDIKNGLAPIRNVLRHLTQVAERDPESLAAVYQERKGTLESSVDYLDTLARNYAKLSPVAERAPCDVNAVVEQVLRDMSTDSRVVQATLSADIPRALADRMVLRRILDNLVGNAVESLAGRPHGTVTVMTEAGAGNGESRKVKITVADTGPGMTRQELDRAFDDFYTTKTDGTGLGLSIVRRLILDLNGTLRVETEPGAGTRMVIELPAAPPGRAT